jgi:hypothetical protein
MSTAEQDKSRSVPKAKRVLGRVGARELTPEEVACVAGAGPEHTNVISWNPVTGQRDGDG